MRQRRILVAPNAFKGGLDAVAAAAAIARGLQAGSPGCRCTMLPVADGGDGTGALLGKVLEAQWIPVRAHDPLLRSIDAGFRLGQGGRTAIIEMADASGLRLLRPGEADPLRADSYGTGELIRAALDAGATAILLGLGGSATVDGGRGALEALGLRVRNGRLDMLGVDLRARASAITLLCDVSNPLLGPDGAAAVFGPQKGASTPQMIAVLDRRLATFAAMARIDGHMPRGGAAGGMAAGLHAVLGADLVDGAETFLDLAGFDAALDQCDLVVTGEGRLDAQTLHGKAPAAVARRARARGIPVIALAGSVDEAARLPLLALFDAVWPISLGIPDLALAMARTASSLERAGCALGARLDQGDAAPASPAGPGSRPVATHPQWRFPMG